MADHVYTTRRYALPQENSYDAWNARNNGFETHSDGWGKTGYASNGEASYPRDHVCRPVVIDAQGIRRPLIAYTPMDNCVTKTETIIERVHQPDEGTHYRNVSPRTAAPPNEYGVMHNGWSAPVSPDCRPDGVEVFISQVQTDASRPPSRGGLVSSTHWRQKFNPNGHGHGGVFGHGKNGDQPHRDGRTEVTVTSEYKEEPALITEGGWARPNRAAWSVPGTLTNPTNDIGTAVEFLKEAATAVPTQRRFAIPTPMVPRMEVVSPNEDNYRRYGGLGPQAGSTPDTYSSSAIDSREAARRYHGQTM